MSAECAGPKPRQSRIFRPDFRKVYLVHHLRSLVYHVHPMGTDTRWKIAAAALEMLDASPDSATVTIRRVAAAVGVSPMAIYKHFPDRKALLKAATSAEYERIAEYFRRANARSQVQGLQGMLGYLEYALDHPNLFRYMFSSAREDAFTFATDLKKGKSPTMNLLFEMAGDRLRSKQWRADDVHEVALSIWAHAHGLIMLHLAGRTGLSKRRFRDVYLRSLNRLLRGLALPTRANPA